MDTRNLLGIKGCIYQKVCRLGFSLMRKKQFMIGMQTTSLIGRSKMLEKINELKSNNPNCMVWFRKILGNQFFIVVSEQRKIVSVETETKDIPLSNEEYYELINDIQDSLSERWYKVQEKENLCVSIENFLDENEELVDAVSFQIHEESERFYDSPIFD